MAKSVFIVKLGFSRITSSALVEKGRNCVTMLTGNAAYPTPTPALSDVEKACDALDTANQAYAFTRSRLDLAARESAFADLKEVLRELGAYVQLTSDGDKDLILSAGFEVEKERQPIGELPVPQDVKALVTPYPGRLEVRWKGVKGRSMYRVEMAEVVDGTTGPWSTLLLTSKNRHTVEGLTSNGVYSFRITALGTAGASPVSDAASAKAA